MYEIEKVQLYACKRFMSAPLRSCNAAVAGDCGRYPMYIIASKRCIKYWLRILVMPDYRYVKKCYNMLLYYDSIGYQNWATKIRNNLYKNGFGYVWESQSCQNPDLFLIHYIQRLKDQYLQDWSEECNNNAKLTSYKHFKTYFVYEHYLDVLDIKKYRYAFCTLRLSSHFLMIELGRYLGIDRDRRFCIYCKNVVENEYHFMLVCPLYHTLREYYLLKKFYESPNIHKFNILMSSKNESIIKSTAVYIYSALKRRSLFIQTS